MLKNKSKIILASAAGGLVVVVLLALALNAVLSQEGAESYSQSFYNEGRGGGYTAAEYAAAPSKDQLTAAMETIEVADMNSEETASAVDQKIIKTGYLEIIVDSADKTTAAISALAAGAGGYLQEISISEEENGARYGTVIARLPAEKFETAMTEIKKLAVSVSTETISGQDVTEEYTDLEAQLRNAQAQEEEYLVILKKAEDVEDILSVQSYLGQVREQIEVLQGHIKYLDNLTSYSTITVWLSEDVTITVPSKEFRPWAAIKEAAQTAVSVLQGLVITAIWLIILGGGVVLPVAVVVWLIVKLVRKIWRRRRNKR